MPADRPDSLATRLAGAGARCGVALVVFCCAAGIRAGSLTLTVTEPSGVDRTRWPVTAGVPFPRGELKTGAVTLTDAAGTPTPCDSRVTARWRDGSVLCLLLDFQTDLRAGESKSFRLSYGEGGAPPAAAVAAPIAVEEAADAITVSTGALSASIARQSFNLLSGVTLADGVPLLSAPGSMFVDVEATPPGEPNEEEWLRRSGAPKDARPVRFDPVLSKAPFTSRVEWRGRMRVVVRLDGRHASRDGREGWPYTVRLTFHAGKPWVWLDHTITFSGDVKRNFVRRMAVRHAVGLQGAPAVVLGGAQPHPAPEGAKWASLLEPGNATLRHMVPYTEVRPVGYRVDAGASPGQSREVASGEWAQGWATLRGERWGVTSAVRHFDKLWPKEVAVDASAGTITQYLWPDRGGLVLDLRRRYDYVENEVHYDLSMHPNGGEGIARTHEMLLWFHEAATPVEAIEATAKAFERPLFALAPPAWYGSSDFIPRFHPRDPERFPRLEAFMDLAMEWRLRNVPQFGWHGFVDFGDTLFHGYETPCHSGESAPKSWNSRGYVGWLCNDGAEARTILLHFLRSGDLRLFEHWRSMVRHVTDVDTVHSDEKNPEFIGGGHRHDQQHWGNGVRGYGTATFGAMDMHLLTGDLRCLDVFVEHTGFHRRRIAEDEYVGGYLARYAAVTGDEALWNEAAEEVRKNYYGFRTGARGRLDQPHFRSPTIQHPSLIAYLTLSGDDEMRDVWVAAAHKRLSGLQLGYSFLQFAYAYRYSQDPAFLDGLKLAWAMWGPYVSPALRTFNPEQVFKKPLPELSFEELAAVAKRTVNGLYGQIDHAGVWPYALAVAVEAGLGEPELLDSRPRLAKGGVGWDWGWTGAPAPDTGAAAAQPLDIRVAANANPWNELRSYGQPLAAEAPPERDALRFDFQCWGDVEPGTWPVRLPSAWPTVQRQDFTVREEGSYVYGLPWGGAIRLAGVTFGLIHPSANEGKAAIVLRDNETVAVPVRQQAKRLFLLGMVGDAAPFDREVGARLALHYADGTVETQELRNLEHYESWHFWGFAGKAHFARGFKVSSQWDGRTTLLNLLAVPLGDAVLERVELSDAGRGHRLVVLAISVEAAPAAAAAPAAPVDLRSPQAWVDGADKATHTAAETTVTGAATYRVAVPRGAYRMDFEINGSGSGLAEVRLEGVPACTPFTHPKQSLPQTGHGYERISVWGQADDDGLDVTFSPAPEKGLWRHATIHRQSIRIRNVAVTAEAPPAWAAPPADVVRYGWTAPVPDPFRLGTSLYHWQGAGWKAASDMIVGSAPATFRVDLAAGAYEVRVTVPALSATTPRIGLVRPGPARVEFGDGASLALAQPAPGEPAVSETVTKVGERGLSLTIRPDGDAELWGLALLEIRRCAEAQPDAEGADGP